MYPKAIFGPSQCCVRPLSGLCLLLALLLASGCQKPFLVLHDGSRISASQAQDAVIVVNVWAEWCAPCRHEIPELNKLAAMPGVIVLGYDFDGNSGTALDSLTERMGISFGQLTQEPSTIWKVGMARALPVTHVIINQNEVAGSLYGAQTLESLQAAIERARAGLPLEDSAPPPSPAEALDAQGANT